MEYVKVTNENLENEHVCCAISNNKDCQVAAKKAWLSGRQSKYMVKVPLAKTGGSCLISCST